MTAHRTYRFLVVAAICVAILSGVVTHATTRRYARAITHARTLRAEPDTVPATKRYVPDTLRRLQLNIPDSLRALYHYTDGVRAATIKGDTAEADRKSVV